MYLCSAGGSLLSLSFCSLDCLPGGINNSHLVWKGWVLSSTRLKRRAEYSGPGVFLTYVFRSIKACHACPPTCKTHPPTQDRWDQRQMGLTASCSPVPSMGKGGTGHQHRNLPLTPHSKVQVPHMVRATKDMTRTWQELGLLQRDHCHSGWHLLPLCCDTSAMTRHISL